MKGIFLAALLAGFTLVSYAQDQAVKVITNGKIIKGGEIVRGQYGRPGFCDTDQCSITCVEY